MVNQCYFPYISIYLMVIPYNIPYIASFSPWNARKVEKNWSWEYPCMTLPWPVLSRPTDPSAPVSRVTAKELPSQSLRKMMGIVQVPGKENLRKWLEDMRLMAFEMAVPQELVPKLIEIWFNWWVGDPMKHRILGYPIVGQPNRPTTKGSKWVSTKEIWQFNHT